MPEINKANRQVCDLDIRVLANKKPFLFFETANTTTTNVSSENVYARAKGANKIAFANPIEGTLVVEAQVYPFQLFALLSGGDIKADGLYTEKVTVAATEDDKLTLDVPDGVTVVAGEVFVYPQGSYGVDSDALEATVSGKEISATGIKSGDVFEVGVTYKRNDVKRVSINNKNNTKDFFITASTLDKDEDGVLTPFKMVYYKASPQKSFELALSSDGDPATLSVTFDIFEDKDGMVVDMLEIPE